MTEEQIYHRAELEWKSFSDLRAKYATFIYYWHERYELVYGIKYHDKNTSGLFKAFLQH